MKSEILGVPDNKFICVILFFKNNLNNIYTNIIYLYNFKYIIYVSYF